MEPSKGSMQNGAGPTIPATAASGIIPKEITQPPAATSQSAHGFLILDSKPISKKGHGKVNFFSELF